MHPSTVRSTWLRRALLPAASLLAALPAAHAQTLYATVLTGSSGYQYNTNSGVVSSSGNGTGTVNPGAPLAFAASSSDEGGGAFHTVQSATASADYATAGLHTTIFTDGYYSQGNANAQITDLVTFHVAGGSASTVTQIGLDLTLDGSISVLQQVSYLYNLKMYTQGAGGVSAGWTTVLYDSPDDPRNYWGWAVSGGAGEPDGFDSWQLLASTPTEKHLHGVFSFTGAQKEYEMNLGFAIRCSGGTDCDFGNSAHINFTLPAGVTMTSASGLLLTAVPEPQSYALMLGGMAMIGWFTRRRLGATSFGR